MKAKAVILKVDTRVSKNGNTFFPLWVNVEGMEVPGKVVYFPEKDRPTPEKGMPCIVYTDLDQYCNLIVRVRL